MARITDRELAQLADELGASLVLFARQWCSCPDDALQEALIELVNKEPVPSSPKAWLFRVVRHKAMNLARSQRRRDHHESAASASHLWFESDDGTRMDAEVAAQWLEHLPDIQRQIVTARIWGELTFEQIAEVVDRPTASVFRLLQEALETLRRKFEPSTDPRIATDRSKRTRS